ncbi:hypothetical protein LPB90_13150 [Chryseobacterium sp. LC2016-29]|uniref:hypothetical protein n=1 Tax=Chryseobacterium sp. LC2016-29 TaxID=2897331 RepID=UPI001E39A293|nr:hypothetical protein [Chryseobacterium sp. LC2016-29]MCD0479402.1 hypothetical protein [Chryseobacterium sp. LC2016-29]
MSTMKTSGVYIVEKNNFPNSVVEVATAVPAFIGYTEIVRPIEFIEITFQQQMQKS